MHGHLINTVISDINNETRNIEVLYTCVANEFGKDNLEETKKI